EIDVAVEDAGFARQLAEQYERDLENATEIVLAPHRHRALHTTDAAVRSSERRPSRVRGGGGSSSRAAVGALRVANQVSSVLSNQRVLDSVSGGPLFATGAVLAVFAVTAVLWPAWIGWPLAAIAAWFALNLGIASWRKYRRHQRRR